jgi:peptidoglycan/LPS O-acetylase OafA/YrhL
MSAPPPSRPAPSLWATLSLLRFGLAAIVAAAHVKAFYGGTLAGADPVRWLASFNGHAAVVGFLLVSGFSIAHSIRAESSGYLWRRFLRIYPLYLPAVLFSAWVGGYEVPGNGTGPAIAYPAPGTGETLGNLLMLQCVLVAPLSNNGPLWTLSLEWWCYMAAPFLVLLSQRRLLLLLAVLAAAHLSWLVIGPRLGFYARCPFGLHILFLGVFWLAGYCYYEMRHTAWAGWALLVLVWLLTGINRDNLGGNSQATLALSCLLLVAGASLPWPAWTHAALKLLGNASYSLYLLHKPLYHLAHQELGLNQGWQLLTLAIAAAIAAHLLVETPVRKVLQTVATHLKSRS